VTIPSVKTIKSIDYLDRVHGCDRDKTALVIRKILDDRLDPLEYIESCQDKDISGAHWITFDIPYYVERYSKIEQKLWAINQILECHGVEGINNHSGHTDLAYCNTGETYDNTVCYDYRKDKFVITSYGDWVERNDPNGTKY
jgi:hypothetical protein